MMAHPLAFYDVQVGATREWDTAKLDMPGTGHTVYTRRYDPYR